MDDLMQRRAKRQITASWIAAIVNSLAALLLLLHGSWIAGIPILAAWACVISLRINYGLLHTLDEIRRNHGVARRTTNDIEKLLRNSNGKEH
jgi:hypothetical protein